VAELVKAKIVGRALPKKKAPAVSKQIDLLQALRESAGIGGKAPPRPAADNANKSAARKKAAKLSAARAKQAAAPTRRAG
jgi:DNA end-binding protein Ku